MNPEQVEDQGWRLVSGYWIGATPAFLIANSLQQHFGPLPFEQAKDLVGKLNALESKAKAYAQALREIAARKPHWDAYEDADEIREMSDIAREVLSQYPE